MTEVKMEIVGASDVPAYEVPLEDEMTFDDHKRTIMEVFSMACGEDWMEMTPYELAHCLAHQVKNDKLVFDLRGISKFTANVAGLGVPQ